MTLSEQEWEGLQRFGKAHGATGENQPATWLIQVGLLHQTTLSACLDTVLDYCSAEGVDFNQYVAARLKHLNTKRSVRKKH